MKKATCEQAKAASVQAFAAISKLLDDEAARIARCKLITNTKDFCCWCDEEKDNAELVCSRYGSVAIMVKYDYISKKIIIEEWGCSIIQCYDCAKPMIDEYRKPENENDYRDKNYRADFEWLYKEACKNKTLSHDS